MANSLSPKELHEHKVRAITYKVLCAIVKNFEEATLPEIRAKYASVSRPWDLPLAFVNEESARSYLNQGVRNGVMRYERRRKGKVIERRLNGMSDGAGYYIWIDKAE